MRFLLILAMLAVPFASAQDTVQGTYPPDAAPPDTEESVESGPGFAYGGAVLLLVLVFAAALGWAAWRQSRRPPSRP